MGWRPNWAIPPGEILQEELQARDMTPADLAYQVGCPYATVDQVLRAEAALTPELATDLERVLGISACLWTGLENNYREYLAWEATAGERV